MPCCRKVANSNQAELYVLLFLDEQLLKLWIKLLKIFKSVFVTLQKGKGKKGIEEIQIKKKSTQYVGITN